MNRILPTYACFQFNSDFPWIFDELSLFYFTSWVFLEHILKEEQNTWLYNVTITLLKDTTHTTRTIMLVSLSSLQTFSKSDIWHLTEINAKEYNLESSPLHGTAYTCIAKNKVYIIWMTGFNGCRESKCQSSVHSMPLYVR